jgi:hypothetical protein
VDLELANLSFQWKGLDREQPLEIIVAVDLPSGNNGLVKTTMKKNELTNMLRWQELTCQQKKSI